MRVLYRWVNPETVRSLRNTTLAFAVLGLLGFAIYSAIFGPSREMSVMRSYDITKAEPDSASVDYRYESDGGWTPFGSMGTSIAVGYDVNDGSTRETVIAELLEAAEADGWHMEEQAITGVVAWQARRGYPNSKPNQTIQLFISSRNPDRVTLTLSPNNRADD